MMSDGRVPAETARIVRVIETTSNRRGNGDTTPVRTVTRYWNDDGKLLAEYDACLMDDLLGIRELLNEIRMNRSVDDDDFASAIKYRDCLDEYLHAWKAAAREYPYNVTSSTPNNH